MADLTGFFDSGFDDTSIQASTGMPEPMPPGDYQLMVESTDISLTKDQTGAYLKCVLTVASGEFEGRKIFPQFNIKSKSMQVQQIGIGEFKALCLAADVPYEVARSDTDALLHKPFMARVGMEKEQINPATNQPYPPRNKVLKYMAAGAPSPVATPTAAPTAPVAMARPSTPSAGLPWGNKAA